ncbi:hypothetical protein GP486_001680 [Trichoglossum hirsutum]|uniref:Uncharacterized protein n=1 Tax=Trichoglossum hirsutum TaxID=265104 RepID=A0A9P8LFN6_9PEZI|nr:hypothetical protein GP486_001680 [Trichoglossum hirsutum]
MNNPTTRIFKTLALSVSAKDATATTTDAVLVEVIYDKAVTSANNPPSSTPPPATDPVIHVASPAEPPGTPPAPSGTGVGNSTADSPGQDANSSPVRVTSRFQLDSHLSGSTVLSDVVYPSTLNIQVLGGDGIPRAVLLQDVSSSSGSGVKVELDAADVSKILAKIALPPARPGNITRAAIFVEIAFGNAQTKIDFSRAKLLIVPLRFTKDGKEWHRLGLDDFFGHQDGPISIASSFTQPIARTITSLPWSETRLAVDGKFTATFVIGKDEHYNAWAWLLTGARPYGMMGIISGDEIKDTDSQVRAIILPTPPKDDKGTTPTPENGNGEAGGTSGKTAGSDQCQCDGSGSRIPVVVSESELANNPDVYTEDPGSFCKPFRNPERILSEKAMYSVLRIEQPEISASASSVIRNPILDFERNPFLSFKVENPAAALPESPILRRSPFVDGINLLGSGRRDMDAQHPIQWEGDSLRYQATTVARGHILEFRMRTRSNGYSLGGVAKTLTLAPRQTKRIQKIEWSRSERARRVEGTQLADTTNDSMNHETSYQDAAAASLNEWAQGSSQSSVTSGAAGGGLALGPFVIGGGVAHSSSQSSSQQSGGRNTTASEESQWRDAVRRHGDALRKFESTVVQEVNEMEAVTGTTEVIRNINYGHSLTVIYHNILRHLRVDTEFSSARECLFVPFAIRPFTKERALRWKDNLSQALRNRSFSRALTYLKDVVTNFQNSPIPPGRRSDHQIRSLWGSLYIELAIARPGDTGDGKFDAPQWAPVLPFLPMPAFGMFQQLGGFDVIIRDQIFQQRFASTIATKWCDNLQITDAKQVLNVDFTLATPYRFNSTVRVDFQVATDGTVTRETLSSIKVSALKALPPGSIANIKSLSYNYETDFEKGSAAISRGVNDLIVSETGQADLNGAQFTSVPTAYERQDLRHDLQVAADDLVDHLNEYVEYYHKAIWWLMDRDRLFMLLDGFTVPKMPNPVSIANVVERDPIAVAGNSVVFRVSAGVFLGSPELNMKTPEDLHDYYNANKTIQDPMHISLPTDGLYAKTIMDDCVALEEHHGNHDWALADPDPELGALDASLLASRRSEPPDTKPTTLPSTIINLSNATPAPAPQGFAGVLGAVQNANAFRDMAGLAGTQQLAQAGLQTAASLATTFGGSAAALEMARINGKQQAVADADKKLASIQRAKDKNLVSSDEASKQAVKVLGDFSGPDPAQAPNEAPSVSQLVDNFAAHDSGTPKTFEASNAEGSVRLAFGVPDPDQNAGALLASAGSGAVIGATGSLIKPKWSTFNNVYWTYPKISSPDVLARINKSWVGQVNYQNTCTMRLSQALIDSGFPPVPTLGVTLFPSPITKKKYIIRVLEMQIYLTTHWGDPDFDTKGTKKAGDAFDPAAEPKMKDKPGVIGFLIDFPPPGPASGHFDLWDGKKFSHEMPGGWDGAGTPPHDYWKRAKRIMLWYLPD